MFPTQGDSSKSAYVARIVKMIQKADTITHSLPWVQ